MPTITLNEKGSRHLELTDENLRTIEKYNLFDTLIDSHGYITDETLERLRLTVRSLIASTEGDTRPLLNLCLDVIYAPHFKAYSLGQLFQLYTEWKQDRYPEQPNEFFA